MNTFLKKLFFFLLFYLSFIESVIKKNFSFSKSEKHLIIMQNGFDYLMYLSINDTLQLSELIIDPSDELMQLIEEVAFALHITDTIEVMISTDKMFLLSPLSQLIITNTYCKGKMQLLINETWLNTLTHDQKKFIIAFHLIQLQTPKSLLLQNILTTEEKIVQEHINAYDYIVVPIFMNFLYSDPMKDFYKDKTILGFSIIQNAWWKKIIQSIILACMVHSTVYGCYHYGIKKYAWYCNERYYIDSVREVLNAMKGMSLEAALQVLNIYRDGSLKIFAQNNMFFKDTIYDAVIRYITWRIKRRHSS